MIIGLLLANMAMMISMFVYFQGRFDKMDEKFDRRFDKIDRRFEKIDERFDKIDERFGQIEKDVQWIKFQHGHVPEESKEN